MPQVIHISMKEKTISDRHPSDNMSVTFVEFSGCNLSITKLFCHESKSSSLVASLGKDLYCFKRFPFYSAFSIPFSHRNSKPNFL